MSRRQIPEINAGSMADIAFLLLIFFLVTTTMDVDAGISRKLPEKPNPLEKPPIIKEKNILVLTLDKSGTILMEGDTYIDLKDVKPAAIKFLDNGGGKNAEKEDCTYCKGEKDPTSSDHPDKAVISLESARNTNYGAYIRVQDELVSAYNFLLDRSANELYGMSYADLKEKSEDDQLSDRKKESYKEKYKKVKGMYPMIISEAEPTKF
ncbi:MAG: biopolymer transporter ExbD [Flavobacteriaceae bacterium]